MARRDSQQQMNFAACTADLRSQFTLALRYHCRGADLRHWLLVDTIFRVAHGEHYVRSYEEIAGLLWCSRRSAIRIVQDLLDWGILTCQEQVLRSRGQRENAYGIDWRQISARIAGTDAACIQNAPECQPVTPQCPVVTPQCPVVTPQCPVVTPIKEDTALLLHSYFTSSSMGGAALLTSPGAAAAALEEVLVSEEQAMEAESESNPTQEQTSRPIWITVKPDGQQVTHHPDAAGGLSGEEMADLALRLKGLGLVATGRLVAELDAAGATLAEVEAILAFWQGHRERFLKPAAALYTRLKNHRPGQPADQGWGRSLAAAARQERRAKRDAAITERIKAIAQVEREAAESRARQEPLRAMQKSQLMAIAARLPAGFARSQVERMLAAAGEPSDLVVSILQSQLESEEKP